MARGVRDTIGSHLRKTVKTHIRTLYSKLGVSSREAAVRQANAVGLTGIGDSPG